MTNQQIIGLYNSLAKLIMEKVDAKLALKLYRLEKQVRDEYEPIVKTIEGMSIESEEFKEIMAMEQEVEFDQTINFSDLEDLELSAWDIGMLEPIINFEEE